MNIQRYVVPLEVEPDFLVVEKKDENGDWILFEEISPIFKELFPKLNKWDVRLAKTIKDVPRWYFFLAQEGRWVLFVDLKRFVENLPKEIKNGLPNF